MRADNDGEGGILALMALVQRAELRSRGAQLALVALGHLRRRAALRRRHDHAGHLGALGVEGLEVADAEPRATRRADHASSILSACSSIQRCGTGAVGGLFGPVMVRLVRASWRSSGSPRSSSTRRSCAALSPTYARRVLRRPRPRTAFLALGAVVLAVTGGEALYADMGHFGRAADPPRLVRARVPGAGRSTTSARARWCSATRARASNPFYLLVPDWALIAAGGPRDRWRRSSRRRPSSPARSRSPARRCSSASCRALTIRHTSTRGDRPDLRARRQLDAARRACVALVLGFGSSSNLAAAYGIAVTGTMAIDTCCSSSSCGCCGTSRCGS